MILGFVMLPVGVSVAPYQIAQNGSTTATVTGYNMDGTVSVEVWNNDLSAKITSGVVVTPGEGSAASRKYAIKISADFELGDYKVVPTINGVRQTGVAGASLIVTDTPVGEYTVSGTITGSDAPGGLAADVQLKQNGVDVGAPVKAGADGKYVISNVAPGIGYTVHAAISGYTANESEAFEVVGVNVTGKDLVLKKASAFTIVLDPDGVIKVAPGKAMEPVQILAEGNVGSVSYKFDDPEKLAKAGVFAIEDEIITGTVATDAEEGGYYVNVIGTDSEGNIANAEFKLEVTLNNEYSLTYDANSDAVVEMPIPSDSKHVAGATVNVQFSPRPAWSKNSFLGWATTKDAVVPDYTENGTKTFVMGSEDVTLYGVWAAAPAMPPQLAGIVDKYLVVPAFFNTTTLIDIWLLPDQVGIWSFEYNGSPFIQDEKDPTHWRYNFWGFCEVDDLLVKQIPITSEDLILDTSYASKNDFFGTFAFANLNPNTSLDITKVSVEIDGVVATRATNIYNFSLQLHNKNVGDAVDVKAFYDGVFYDQTTLYIIE